MGRKLLGEIPTVSFSSISYPLEFLCVNRFWSVFPCAYYGSISFIRRRPRVSIRAATGVQVGRGQ